VLANPPLNEPNELPELDAPAAMLELVVATLAGIAGAGFTPSGIISFIPEEGALPSNPLKFSIRVELL
jgi:hypothetical protein